MRSAGALTVTTATHRDIITTRVFNAPGALVFEALTKPEHVFDQSSYPGQHVGSVVLMEEAGQTALFAGAATAVVPAIVTDIAHALILGIVSFVMNTWSAIATWNGGATMDITGILLPSSPRPSLEPGSHPN